MLVVLLAIHVAVVSAAFSSSAWTCPHGQHVAALRSVLGRTHSHHPEHSKGSFRLQPSRRVLFTQMLLLRRPALPQISMKEQDESKNTTEELEQAVRAVGEFGVSVFKGGMGLASAVAGVSKATQSPLAKKTQQVLRPTAEVAIKAAQQAARETMKAGSELKARVGLLWELERLCRDGGKQAALQRIGRWEKVFKVMGELEPEELTYLYQLQVLAPKGGQDMADMFKELRKTAGMGGVSGRAQDDILEVIARAIVDTSAVGEKAAELSSSLNEVMENSGLRTEKQQQQQTHAIGKWGRVRKWLSRKAAWFRK